MTVAWLNGVLFDELATRPSPLDPGLLVGDGVFTTVGVYNGRPFMLPSHLERLGGSSLVCGFGELNIAAVHRGIAQVLGHPEISGSQVARLRVTVWRTADELGLTPHSSGTALSVIAAPASADPLGVVNRATAKVVTSRFVRNERSAIAGHKSTSYAENAYALRAARQHGADEAILFNSVGDLSEATTSNIVVDVGGELLTPPLSSGCLPGVTRALALEWGQEAGLPIREAESGELTDSIVGKPAALMGTLRNIQAIGSWDGLPVEASRLVDRLAREFATRSLDACEHMGNV